MNNKKTFLHGVASLIRIQSTPVTVLTLLLGYAVVADSIFTTDLISLTFVGAVGHWGFYALNDISDYEWDVKQNRRRKPIVSGEVGMVEAKIISLHLILVSLTFSLILFPQEAFATWVMASILGGVYNMRSKHDSNSQIYLGLWGSSVVLTGSYIYGDINITSLVLSIIVGVHMVWMTMMGDLKDIDNGEDSLPSKMGCYTDGYYLHVSDDFESLSIKIIAIESSLIVMILFLPDLLSYKLLYLPLALLGIILIMSTGFSVLRPEYYDRDVMKRDITLHEIATILTVAVAVMANTYDKVGVLSIVLLSVLWGVLWQRVLYGHYLRFP